MKGNGTIDVREDAKELKKSTNKKFNEEIISRLKMVSGELDVLESQIDTLKERHREIDEETYDDLIAELDDLKKSIREWIDGNSELLKDSLDIDQNENELIRVDSSELDVTVEEAKVEDVLRALRLPHKTIALADHVEIVDKDEGRRKVLKSRSGITGYYFDV